MPLLYGEREKAFQRLQEGILKISDDHSILAFRSLEPPGPPATEGSLCTPVLAGSPDYFQDDIQLDWSAHPGKSRTSFVDGDLSIELLICQPLESPFGNTPQDHYIGILDCVIDRDLLSRPAILLRKLEGSDKFLRVGNGLLFKISPDDPTCCTLLGYEDEGDYRVTLNASDARRARITLTTLEPSAGPRETAWKFPPVKLSGLDKLHEKGFRIAKSTTTLSKGYLAPQAAAESIGIVSLVGGDEGGVGLVVIWGFSPVYPSGPWCRIQTEDKFASGKSRRLTMTAFLDRLIQKAGAGDEQTCLALRPDVANRRKTDSVIVGFQPPVTITIKFSIISFLDRTAIELQLDAVSGTD